MEKIKITPLGGLGEVGKNLLLFEINSRIYIIDAGIKFSSDPEIDYILPDLDYLEQIKNKVEGIFITHGHEDHIGGISKLGFLNVPIYSPPLAKELIKKKILRDQRHLLKDIQINKIFHFKDFNISWFPVVHSIPDSCGLLIRTKKLNIIHTGDFRFDKKPIFGKNTNFEAINREINNKCDVLLSDSTNAMIYTESFSEKEIEKTFERVFKKNKKIIICTFASQISRIQMAINVAKRSDKKIVLLGSTLQKNLKISKNLSIISDNDQVLLNIKSKKTLENDNVVYFVTGSQGEEFSVLNRMSKGNYNNLKIEKDDIVLMSSSVIPGNEQKVFEVIHRIHGLGAEVNFSNIETKLHVSGHSNNSELGTVIKSLKPKYLIPIHGNFDMLNAHKKIGLDNGLKNENIFVLSNGDNLEITSQEAKIIDHEKIIDEVVLRDNFSLDADKKSNIYNNNILSVIIKTGEIQDKNSIDIKLFDKSNNIKIINNVKNFILNSMTEISNTEEGWNKITKQLNKNLYKLILENFNKKYLIKSLFIEK